MLDANTIFHPNRPSGNRPQLTVFNGQKCPAQWVRKGGLLLWCVLAASPCMAQKKFVFPSLGNGAIEQAVQKEGLARLRESALPAVLRRARVVQGKILPNEGRVSQRGNFHVERLLLKRIVPTPPEKLQLQLIKPTAHQREEAALLYAQVMASFQQFKAETTPFLYYQSKSGERHVLSPAEKNEWSGKIQQIQRELLRLKYIIYDLDEAYRSACAYVGYAQKIILPEMAGLFFQKKSERPDRRIYSADEFYLRVFGPKHPAAWENNWPEPLRVAVLNDNTDILDSMVRSNSLGSFLPGWELTVYSNAEELLNSVTKRGKHFDMVLTDIIVPGGGGYYLAAALRENGYTGSIIALSAFDEDATRGQQMFECGFDAMISWSETWTIVYCWKEKITQKLKMYFYYRDKNGWAR